MKGDQEKCLQAGMDDYVSKPISLQDLGDALKRWTGKAQAGAEQLL
jgi:CheY-like chemotaxis protein